MTVEAGRLLVEEIAPRIRKAIPRNVPQIGHEDYEELIQDAIVIAAQMLSRVETQGKQFTATSPTTPVNTSAVAVGAPAAVSWM